ncbi:MAG TPA: ATP synthase F1 subunit delta [Solirubrobacteraceae bacterium]|nr:ATP synthase F1 subunit delta [Solirubrobacteraceae bacterium]
MEEVAEVYARALFEVARDQDRLDDVHDQLGQFTDALEQNRDLAVFFFSPYFSSEEKKAALGRAIEGADPAFFNFLEALIERHRMPVIFRARTQFHALWEDERKLLDVDVTTAVEMDEAAVQSIGQRVQQQTGRTVELSSQVDPDILGGIVLRVGNLILDASIRHRLEQLRKQVAAAQ